jgi:hypothetical protein
MGAGNDTIRSTGTTLIDEIISDFNSSGTDIIQISDAAYVFVVGDGSKSGALVDNVDIFDTANVFGGSFTGGSGITFLYDTADGQVCYDADGSGGVGSAILLFTIANFASYTYDATDFVAVV